MKTTTKTTVIGEETVIKDVMNIAYEVDIERYNKTARIIFYIIIDDARKKIDEVFKCLCDTFEDNLQDALSEATEKWKIEVELKKTA